VLRGSLGLGAPLPPMPSSGVALQAQLNSFNADAWLAVQQRLFAGLNTSSSWNARNEPLQALDSPYMPRQLDLKIQQLTLGGRPVNQLAAHFTRVPEAWSWRGHVEAEQISGDLDLRDNAAPQGGRIQARLARLSLPKSEADTVSEALDPQSTSVPALDLVVEAFELRGKALGRLEVDAQLQGPRLPGGREWKLNRLVLKNADAQLSASGQWKLDPGQAQRRTQLDWQLDLNDAGHLLERLGQGQVLRGGQGAMQGRLSWPGSPLSPDVGRMTGQMHLQLNAGQFLKAEPGVGRLLGVLSLQSLPRRLVLDFRDVFSQGFAFDRVGGDVQIAQGLARSSNLAMRGVQASVLIDGRADLMAETQDLRVLVVPDVNAGGASLAYAAINPAIGLGTFLAQLLLRKPMAAAGTSEFRITGRWDEPKVDEVAHHPSEAASTAASEGRRESAAEERTEP